MKFYLFFAIIFFQLHANGQNDSIYNHKVEITLDSVANPSLTQLIKLKIHRVNIEFTRLSKDIEIEAVTNYQILRNGEIFFDYGKRKKEYYPEPTNIVFIIREGCLLLPGDIIKIDVNYQMFNAFASYDSQKYSITKQFKIESIKDHNYNGYCLEVTGLLNQKKIENLDYTITCYLSDEIYNPFFEVKGNKFFYFKMGDRLKVSANINGNEQVFEFSNPPKYGGEIIIGAVEKNNKSIMKLWKENNKENKSFGYSTINPKKAPFLMVSDKEAIKRGVEYTAIFNCTFQEIAYNKISYR